MQAMNQLHAGDAGDESAPMQAYVHIPVPDRLLKLLYISATRTAKPSAIQCLAQSTYHQVRLSCCLQTVHQLLCACRTAHVTGDLVQQLPGLWQLRST